eukprot:jgi/Botrbrau1/17777/Bobra.0127s0031.2
MRAPMAFMMVLLAIAVPTARLVRAESDDFPQGDDEYCKKICIELCGNLCGRDILNCYSGCMLNCRMPPAGPDLEAPVVSSSTPEPKADSEGTLGDRTDYCFKKCKTSEGIDNFCFKQCMDPGASRGAGLGAPAVPSSTPEPKGGLQVESHHFPPVCCATLTPVTWNRAFWPPSVL